MIKDCLFDLISFGILLIIHMSVLFLIVVFLLLSSFDPPLRTHISYLAGAKRFNEGLSMVSKWVQTRLWQDLILSVEFALAEFTPTNSPHCRLSLLR